MALERVPERWRTPAVARAVTSPSAVLLAGGGMSVAILAGLPVAAAAVVGALAWAGRVALALPRRPPGQRIDPRAVSEPWRTMLREAVEARDRFDRIVRQARPGPLQDHLADVGRRLAEGVEECWRIARQGDALESGLRQLNVGAIRAELAGLEAEKERSQGESRAALERAEQSVRAQLASAERLERVSLDARNRLRVLDAQLDEAVARSVELSLRAGDAADLGPLSADVDSVVGELESLRQALEETSGVSRAAGPGTA